MTEETADATACSPISLMPAITLVVPDGSGNASSGFLGSALGGGGSGAPMLVSVPPMPVPIVSSVPRFSPGAPVKGLATPGVSRVVPRVGGPTWCWPPAVPPSKLGLNMLIVLLGAGAETGVRWRYVSLWGGAMASNG